MTKRFLLFTVCVGNSDWCHANKNKVWQKEFPVPPLSGGIVYHREGDVAADSTSEVSGRGRRPLSMPGLYSESQVWMGRVTSYKVQACPQRPSLHLLKAPQPSQTGKSPSNIWDNWWCNFVFKLQQPIFEDSRFNDLFKLCTVLSIILV